MPGGAAETICAVVVTHDRRDLLRECVTALEGQTRAPQEILVVDNASSDGTAAMLAADFPDVVVHRLEENGGSSGGFHEGIRFAHGRGFDWLWLMDDDTLPTPSALERLLEGRDTASSVAEPATVLASRVLWTDGRLHPMNTTAPALQRMDDLVEGTAHGLLLIRSASYVSLLLHSGAVERHGLPNRRYFIWGDDVEFTARILRRESGYLVPGSVVHHNTATAYTTAEGTPERFFYYVRNCMYMVRSRAWDTQEKLRILWMLLIHIRTFMVRNRWRPGAALAVGRGLLHGVATPPDDG